MILQAAQEKAFAELSADAGELLNEISRLELPDPTTEGQARKQREDYLHSREDLRGFGLTLVDPQWRVAAVLGESDSGLPLNQSRESTLSWVTPLDQGPLDRGQSGSDHVRGLLHMPDGRRVALASRLSHGTGYVVADRLLSDVELSPSVAIGTLPATGVIAWIWTGTLLTVAGYIILIRWYDELTAKRVQAQTTSLKRVQSLMRTRDATIFGLAKLSESRDATTGHHLERIAAYVSQLAMAVHHNPKYSDDVTPQFIELIGISSALHDIGKVGIEDSILLKPGPFNEVERARMEQHSAIGGECLQEIERHLGSSNYLQMARNIAFFHHERWDGTGYPNGLAGEDIPLAARIVAVADVYDALSTRRPYKEPLPHETCVTMIRDEAGKHFDPDLVEAFLKIEGVFQQIGRQYADLFTENISPDFAVMSFGEDTPNAAFADPEPMCGGSECG